MNSIQLTLELFHFCLNRNIYSLATSPNDLQIALVENSSSEDSVSDSCVRFYEVGRSRGEEEQGEEEEDEDELQSQDSDDDDDDDDDGSDDLGKHAIIFYIL